MTAWSCGPLDICPRCGASFDRTGEGGPGFVSVTRYAAIDSYVLCPKCAEDLGAWIVGE